MRVPNAVKDYAGMLAAIVGLVVFFSVKTDYFFTALTFRTIANQMPSAVILAVGMTYVLIVAGIDLSVGSVMALGGAVLGVCMAKAHLPLAVAAVAAIGVGLLCGAINGAVSVAWRLPSFIVTLGMLEIARGATYLVTGSETQYIGASIERLAECNLFGLSLPFLVAVAAVALAQTVLSRTTFGRYMVAIGTNEEAVRLAGIRTHWVKLAVFVICGGLAGLAAVIETARLASADPNAGSGYELQAIAAVVIGGTSLMGGRGSVLRSFFGVLIIAVLGAGLVQIGAREPTKRVVTGCVIVIAVILDYYRVKLQARRRS